MLTMEPATLDVLSPAQCRALLREEIDWNRAEDRERYGPAADDCPEPARELTREQRIEIHLRHRTGRYTQRQLAERYGVSHVTIGRVLAQGVR